MNKRVNKQLNRRQCAFVVTLVALFAVFVTLAAPCFAQLSELDSLAWQFRVNSGGTLLTGNVERLLWITNVELSHVEPESKVWGFKSANTYQYGTFNRRLTENDVISRNFVYLFPKEWLYPYVMVWLEKNYRRKFDMRYQVGPGASVTLVRSKEHSLKLSATLTNERTTFSGTSFRGMPDLTVDVITTWRATARLAGRSIFFDNNLRLLYEAWYQPSVSDAKNYRYHTDIALEIPISRQFSFRTALNYTYENIVLTGVERADMLLTFGLAITIF